MTKIPRECIVASMESCNEYRQCVERIRQSEPLNPEASTKEVAENIHEIFFVRDVHTKEVLYISPAYERVWGRSRDALLENPEDFMLAVHPDDYADVLATLHQQRHDQFFDQEYRIVRPDGEIRWIWVRSFPIRDAAGRVYRVAGLAEDITERKHIEATLKATEARLRSVLESAPDMILTVDRDLSILSINHVPAGLTVDQTLGRHALQYVAPEYREMVAQEIEQVFATGQNGHYEVVARGPYDQPCWYETNLGPLFSGNHDEELSTAAAKQSTS